MDLKDRNKPLLLLLLFFLVQQGWGHPHVFIGVISELVFSETELEKLHMHWVFDDMTSFTMLEDFDFNGDEQFNDSETKNAYNIFLEMQGERNYYTHLAINDSPLVFSKIENFTISFEGICIAYDFDIPINLPINASMSELKLSIYDDENYVKLMLEDERGFSYKASESKIKIETSRYFNMEKSYYYGQLNPEEFSVTFAFKK